MKILTKFTYENLSTVLKNAFLEGYGQSIQVFDLTL